MGNCPGHASFLTHLTQHPMKTSRYRAVEKRLRGLKQSCPMPVLLQNLGLGAHAKPSCRSPFRVDENASWGIFETTTGWRFKDHATEESGDEITLIARLKGWDTRKDFAKIVTSTTLPQPGRIRLARSSRPSWQLPSLAQI